MWIHKYTIGFILLVFLTLFVTVNGIAQNTTHQVKAGETLFNIAREYEVSVQQLRDWNSLSGSQLSIGQQLIIKEQKQNQTNRSGITHTVEPKETLYSISKKYDVSIAEIKQWNDLQAQNLSIGTKLSIYHERSSQPSAPQNAEQSQNKSYYTVKSGDSLFRIAGRHNMSVQRLKELNGLSSNVLQVGQRLAVQANDQPPSLTVAGVNTSAQGKFIRYTLKKPQTKHELLQTFKMDEHEFRALNQGLQDTIFKKGHEVNLLAPVNQRFKNPYQQSNSLRTLGDIEARPYDINGIASTTSGELYDAGALSAAHPNIAMGSIIFVQNNENNRGVFVRINDRSTGSSLTLSEAAWQALGLGNAPARLTMFRRNE
jgi:LysM repeat protein